VYVAVLGGDVEVAQQRQLRIVREFGGQPAVQRGQPLQLVGEFIGAGRLAIGEIAAHDAASGHGGGNHTLLRVVEAGDILDDRVVLHCQRGARDDGYAVVGFLARKHAGVTGGGQFGHGEFIVGQFQFLQAYDVDAALLEPVEQVAQAYFQGVDVPGCDFHWLYTRLRLKRYRILVRRPGAMRGRYTLGLLNPPF
jgi:hypothetical protein